MSFVYAEKYWMLKERGGGREPRENCYITKGEHQLAGKSRTALHVKHPLRGVYSALLSRTKRKWQ